MQPITQIEAAVLPVLDLVVSGVEYELVLDYNAISKAEPLLSKTEDIRNDEGKVVSKSHRRNLAHPMDWAQLTSADLIAICWASFDRNHPEVTLRQVGQMLSPAKADDIFAALFELANPGFLAKVQEAAEAAKKSPEGESPNGEAAVVGA
jgi:hypothetical protein